MIIQTVGNLTLVTKKLNPSVSNRPWETKREALWEHSVINLNRDLVNRYDIWDEKKIKERGERLFDIAKRIWPRPNFK